MQHHINLSKISSWSLVVMSSVLFAGCGSNNQATNSATSNPTANAGGTGGATLTSVTIGYTPTIVLPQPLIGLQNGEYASLMPGTTFGSKVFDAGSGVVEALRAGTIDIGASGPYPALKAYAKTGDIVLLAGAAVGGTELMVSKDSPIKSVKDLKGKRIGVNQLGSTVDSMIRYNLIQAQLNPDQDVRLIEVKPGEQAGQLQGGVVDAVAAPAPWPSQVAAKANARPLLDWKQILDNGNYSAGSLYATKKFAEANPEFIKKFLEAHKTITDNLNKDRAKGDAQVLAAWSKVTKKTLDPAVGKAAFATIKYTADPDLKNLQRFADIALEVGALKKKAELKGFVHEVK